MYYAVICHLSTGLVPPSLATQGGCALQPPIVLSVKASLRLFPLWIARIGAISASVIARMKGDYPIFHLCPILSAFVPSDTSVIHIFFFNIRLDKPSGMPLILDRPRAVSVSLSVRASRIPSSSPTPGYGIRCRLPTSPKRSDVMDKTIMRNRLFHQGD